MQTFSVETALSTTTVLAERFETEGGEARFLDAGGALVASFAKNSWLSASLQADPKTSSGPPATACRIRIRCRTS